MLGRGLQLFFSAFCILAILIELSMDNTSAFVRVASSMDHCNTESAQQCNSTEWAAGSMSHAANTADSYFFEPVFVATATSDIGWLIPRDPEAFVILRPPIV